ncbi:DUF1361 domain-containing protein [Terrimonas sp.]|uniref:DUF1361 domain-containing protein n=1 Tax=Terrimonas sp. TaxID=1914338 RepID=UPI000D51B8C4|nr:DUF1361 domain-containing protein [Terrimonas sp.]PVD49570.1 DUF1361 domain-containing protein [Terrimonas sp.]
MKKKSSINSILYLSLLCTVLLIAIRIIYTGNWRFASLVWNMFLAFLPFIFSTTLLKKINRSKWIQYFLLACWLIFLPNAPYIITDFVHLDHTPPVPFWYDLVIIFWAAWNGLILGFISLLNIEKFLLARFSRTQVNVMVYISLVLCAFGVYAGRYLRWNSWDVVANPHEIYRDVKYIALNPEDNMRTWGVTFLFSVLMIICYYTIKQLKQAMREL